MPHLWGVSCFVIPRQSPDNPHMRNTGFIGDSIDLHYNISASDFTDQLFSSFYRSYDECALNQFKLKLAAYSKLFF